MYDNFRFSLSCLMKCLAPHYMTVAVTPGADLGLFAGGVSVSRSHMSSTYEPGGGGDTCVLLLT